MYISPASEQLLYMGRIDFSDTEAPVFVYPSTEVRFKLKGTSLKVQITNKQCDTDDYYLGYIVDGEQGKIMLSPDTEKREYKIPVSSTKEEHEIRIFKRQDAYHYMVFHGLIIDDEASLGERPRSYRKKIEVYGDSICAGCVSEAADYIGKEDPEHRGEYSNSFYSYVSLMAEKLHAQIHNNSTGGIALLGGEGYFAPDANGKTLGMEDVYDKIQCNPALGELKNWDFLKYTPHLVIVAIGHNDSHPEDYMKEDSRSEKSRRWIEHYESLIRDIRGKYPKAGMVLCTSIYTHSPAWDRAIGLACRKVADERIYHYIFPENAMGTPGHVRAKEADAMSFELTRFVYAMGEEIWE